MSEQDGQNEQEAPQGGGGPVVAIVLGLVIVIAAGYLVMKVEPVEEGGEGAEVVEVVEGDAAPAEEAAAPAEEAPAANLVPLPFDLPNPVFAGTPKDIPAGAHMLPPTGKSRDAFMGPEGVENISYDMMVTSSDDFPLIGTLNLVTDDDKEALDGRWVELAPGKQWVQIDLESEAEITLILVWHRHDEARVYKDMIVQISNDPDFVEGVTTLFNNDYDNSSGMGKGEDYEFFESFEGYLVEANGQKAQYVRCYSNGSTQDDSNHYSEVEVWGKK